MNKKLLKLEIIGFIVVSIIGTLMHFFYEWSGESIIVALLCPVNESPWEHLKLLFFPYFFFGIYEAITLKKDKFNVFFAKYIGITAGIVTTLNIYYLCLGVTGKNIDFVNIASYFVGIAVAFVVSYVIINSSIGGSMANGVSLAMLIVTGIIFVLFTFEPPMIPLFQDPQSLQYGI
ncbi:MAG: DUF6512 family protein [Eubacterium sp.]